MPLKRKEKEKPPDNGRQFCVFSTSLKSAKG
jgi:hypothetical protein